MDDLPDSKPGQFPPIFFWYGDLARRDEPGIKRERFLDPILREVDFSFGGCLPNRLGNCYQGERRKTTAGNFRGRSGTFSDGRKPEILGGERVGDREQSGEIGRRVC